MSELLSDEKTTAAVIAIRPGHDVVGENVTEQDANHVTHHDPTDATADPHHGQLVAGDSRPPQQGSLFHSEELHHFRSHWDRVQASFVDEPRAAVEQADNLVDGVVKRITEQFAHERGQLEKQWARGEDADTEALRQAFQHYRTFFDRLLSF